MLWVNDIRLIANSRQWTVTISSLIVLIISLSIAVSVGAVAVPTTVWSVLLNKISLGFLNRLGARVEKRLFGTSDFPGPYLQLWWVLVLPLLGASLQAVTRNQLADPHLLGISSGGAFGAISRPFAFRTFPRRTDSAAACICWCTGCDGYRPRRHLFC